LALVVVNKGAEPALDRVHDPHILGAVAGGWILVLRLLG